MNNNICLFETFRSINGEVTAAYQGRYCTFIRFAGCNLKCTWCDTPKSQDPNSGTIFAVKSIVEQVHTKHVTITGGEPLTQLSGLENLARALKERGHHITLETNGTILCPANLRDYFLSIVYDFKPPSSGKRPDYEQFYKIVATLRETDFMKFPIQNENDFEIAKPLAWAVFSRSEGTPAFSPVSPMSPGRLIYLLEGADLTNAVLNVQLHKYIGVA